MRVFVLLAALVAAPLWAQGTSDVQAQVSADRLESDVNRLISFGTRHTLSDADQTTRGIGAARRWAASEFEAASAACAGCLEIVYPQRMEAGDRIPEPVLIRNVVAIQWGTQNRDEVVIVMGHIDSRGSDVMDAEIDAPGANDNASGSALVLETARVLSQQSYPTTIVYALLSGEEQGLFGGELLADYAAAQGWTVKAVLNNDVVGGSCGSDSMCDAARVRVFSEGIRADADDRMRAAMRSRGGANDSPSRNLSRWLAQLAGENAAGLQVRQTWRSDRIGRGGDHLPFLDAGYPAIRFSAAIEDYDHQHQDLRVEDGVTYGDTADEMDFAYLADVTRLNVRAADRLARTPMPPAVQMDAAMRPSTLLRFAKVEGAISYRIYQRRTDAPDWPGLASLTLDANNLGEGLKLHSHYNRSTPYHTEIAESSTGFELTLHGRRGDDWIFGVSSVAADGSESPIASAVPGGAFYPLAIDSGD